jgi:glycosyltransferase involved in cell wall biosynthesis
MDFFAELAEQPDLDIHVVFAAASENDRQFTVPADIPFSAQIMRSETWVLVTKDAHYVKGLSKHLVPHTKVDLAVISGSYFMPAAIQFRWWANRHRIPWIYWGENPRKKVATGRSRWKDIYLHSFLRSASGAFGVGQQACKVYRKILSSEKSVFNLPYAPNLRPLTAPSESVRTIAQAYRGGWGVEHPEILLFSGSLSERKAPDMLVNAFTSLAANYPRLCLLIAGDGPMRASLEEQVAAAGLRDRSRFLGFLEGDALRAAYLSSDLFVLPTRTHEGWGVVVQEALAAGLPVLVSDRVGSGYDLVESVTGRVFSADDQGSLVYELESLLQDSSRSDPSKRAARIRKAEATGSRSAALRAAETLRNAFFDAAQKPHA